MSNRNATLTLRIGDPEVMTSPSFADDTGNAQSWTQNTAIAPIAVPEASGNPTPTYAAIGSLPSGIGFNTSTRIISGTPTGTGSGTIRIRATNSEGSDDWTVGYTTTEAEILTLPVLTLIQTASENVYTWTNPGGVILQLVCAEVTPIVSSSSYNTVLSSIPTSQLTQSYDRPATQPYYALRNPSTDEFSNTVGPADNVSASTPTVDITTPSNSTVASGDVLNLMATASDPTNQALTYQWEAISAADYSDLGTFLNSMVRDTTWTAPVVTSNETIFLRLTVTDTDDISVNDSIVVTVTPSALTSPSFSDDTGDAQAWTQDVAIAPIAVPEASGDPTPTYAAIGSLPAGIGFNTSTRVISGTPTSTGSGTIRIRATNSEGSDDWTVGYTTTAATAPDLTIDTPHSVSYRESDSRRTIRIKAPWYEILVMTHHHPLPYVGEDLLIRI